MHYVAAYVGDPDSNDVVVPNRKRGPIDDIAVKNKRVLGDDTS